MKQLKLNEGERLQILAALVLFMATAKQKQSQGTNMRLANKVWSSLIQAGGR